MGGGSQPPRDVLQNLLGVSYLSQGGVKPADPLSNTALH